MISLEEENKELKQIKGGIKQSTYSNYSVGELLKSGQIPDKYDETDQRIREIGQESISTLSKNSYSSEMNSPHNSVQSIKQITESGSETISNFQGLETIPENTEENISINRIRGDSSFGEVSSKKGSNIHLSMPVYEGKNNEVLKQPGFMFNSLPKGNNNQKINQIPTFTNQNKGQESFMFRTGETGSNYNPFRKTNQEIDIEIESENSNITTSREQTRSRISKNNSEEVNLI